MISIVTPVYNGERFIESCIEVVIAQEYPDIEHVIVDGGSTDRTAEIIQRYAEKHGHIRRISEKDRGQADAMNKGISMAAGEILGILNVDDYYEPNLLTRVARYFETLPEPSLLVGNCNVWDEQGNIIVVNKPAKLKLEDLLLGFFAHPHPVNPSAYFYHTSLHAKVGSYKVEEHYALDLDFLLRAVQVAHVKYVDEVWGNQRLIEGTKTLDDVKSGKIHARMKYYHKLYRRNLPIFRRLMIAVRYEIYNNKYSIYRIVKIYKRRRRVKS
jgi:glycosyltransferase involved in cell wall biosynthesis